MAARDTTNLLKHDLNPNKDARTGYHRRSYENINDWVTALHQEAQETGKVHFVLSKNARSNLVSTADFRIDMQEYCEIGGQHWYVLQLQENVPRPKTSSKEKNSTTVFTTYIHAEAYNRTKDPRITCQGILAKWRKIQTWHAFPEMTIYASEVKIKGGQSQFALETVPRSPRGLFSKEFTNKPVATVLPE